MIEYQIVEKPTGHQLAKEVEYLIDIGWEPVGGVTIVNTVLNRQNLVYAQAMLKKKSKWS